MANRSAFTHKPKGNISGVFVHPTATKALWDTMWVEAKKADWWEEGVGYVGNKDGIFYFNITGLNSGFAALDLSYVEGAK